MSYAKSNPLAAQVKVFSKKEWEELYTTTYSLMCVFADDDMYEHELVYLERFIEAWRKHIVLPQQVEDWLNRRRDARSIETIQD